MRTHIRLVVSRLDAAKLSGRKGVVGYPADIRLQPHGDDALMPGRAARLFDIAQTGSRNFLIRSRYVLKKSRRCGRPPAFPKDRPGPEHDSDESSFLDGGKCSNRLLSGQISREPSSMKAPQRQKLLDAVYTRDGGRCVYCGIMARRPGKGMKRGPDLATLDHIIPRSAGGPLNQSNLVLACDACNNERGVMDSDVFRALKMPGRRGA